MRRCRSLSGGPDEGGGVLFIEYDVDPDGDIELVALVNAVEEDGQDEDGSAWMAWRSPLTSTTPDGVAWACRPTTSPRWSPPRTRRGSGTIVERIILADRAGKEEVP